MLTDSLGYVLSQGSAFLLDADDPTSFDFPANYVVLNFSTPPPIAASAALFRTVGRIDPELFETDTSGYTQFGRAYLSLQSAVPDEQFIAGYVRGRGGVRRRVHADRQRHAVTLPGRRRLPGQRLDRQHARRGIPVADPGPEPSRAGPHPRVPPSRHPGGPPPARTQRSSLV